MVSVNYPVINPNKPGKVRRVFNGTSKFLGQPMNKSVLVGPDLLQNLLHVVFALPPKSISCLRPYRGFVSSGWGPPVICSLCTFCGTRMPLRMWKFFSTTGRFLLPGTSRREHLSHFSEQLGIKLKTFLKHLKQYLLGSKWMITSVDSNFAMMH